MQCLSRLVILTVYILMLYPEEILFDVFVIWLCLSPSTNSRVPNFQLLAIPIRSPSFRSSR